MTIRMLQQRVLIAQIPDEPTTVGNLFIPETVTKNIARGKILAIDEGKLRVDDEVIYDPRQAIPFVFESVECSILHESQIFAVVRNLTSS